MLLQHHESGFLNGGEDRRPIGSTPLFSPGDRVLLGSLAALRRQIKRKRNARGAGRRNPLRGGDGAASERTIRSFLPSSLLALSVVAHSGVYRQWNGGDLRRFVRSSFSQEKIGSLFRTVRFDAGGDDDPASAARRVLAIFITTTPPNFIVIGIDRRRNQMLVHQVRPTGIPKGTEILGGRAGR